MTMSNSPNSVLILGSLFLWVFLDLNIIVTVLTIVFGVVTWQVPSFSDERLKLLKAEIELKKAKTEYYKSNKKVSKK